MTTPGRKAKITQGRGELRGDCIFLKRLGNGQPRTSLRTDVRCADLAVIPQAALAGGVK